jgi:sarcosine oxidase subunit beta
MVEPPAVSPLVLPSRADVVIVGGGITGLALAWELSQLGLVDVVVLERAYTGSGASGRNVARLRAMQLTPELSRFALQAQRKHERLGRQLGFNTLFWRAGYAWVLYEDEEVERMASLLPMLAELGIRPRLCDPKDTLRRISILRGGERPAGALIGRDALVHHDAVIYGYRKACIRAGVRILEGTEVTGLLSDGSAVAGVAVGDHEIRSRFVVNATEGWSRSISEMAAVDVPNAPVRREVLVTEPARPFMSPAVTFYRPVEGWFNQTLRGELVAGVVRPDEPEGLNQGSTFNFLQRTASLVLQKAPRLGHLNVIRQWAGVYDMTPDRKPVIGPVERVPGFVQANGYSGRGFALAPLCAELLAQWLMTGDRPAMLEPFDANRFADRTADSVLTTDYYAAYQRSG